MKFKNRLLELKKRDFPEIDNVDWAQLMFDSPNVFEGVVGDILKVKHSKKVGKVSKKDGYRKFQTLVGLGRSELPFAEAFKCVTKDETIRRTATKVGVSPAYIYNLQQGTTEPTIEVIEKIADAYGLSPSYFIEYRIAHVLFSIERFLARNPETATAWFLHSRGGYVE